MPDIIVHNRMGRSVYKKLPKEISAEIDREIYRIGLLGPDPYSHYRFFAFPLRHGINLRMVAMHRTRTCDFLVEMAKFSRKPEMFSYLAGFLCHYALDSTTHPYINKISNNEGYLHMAIEHKLDVIELDKLGLKLSDRAVTRGFYPPFLPESMRRDYETVMKNVYGWKDSWEKFKASYRHHKFFNYIAEDPYGIVDLVLHKAPYALRRGKISVFSYRSRRCDGMTFEEFEKLKKKSVKRAVQMIEAVDDFRNGRISEASLRKIIGDKDYSGVVR
ncbi:MAG TPA: hypothetical protein DCF49_05520 [Lachnospiraceae bacterium]|nr:hypothetical protein [Lachnospiraceae bacterium]